MPFSPLIRFICGVLGLGGVVAIAFNALRAGGIDFDFAFFSGLLGSFLFLYAAFFGALPWRRADAQKAERGVMSRKKWQVFWMAAVTFLVMSTAFLTQKGVFNQASLVVLGMVALLFMLVGVALYVFVRDRPDDMF